MRREIQQLLAIVDQAYNRQSWHGTNLRGSIRRVTAADASWRPAQARHNIWETVVHAAYWKYAAARRFTGGARGSFPLKGSNWFVRPVDDGGMTEQAWRSDVELLDRMHELLRGAVAGLTSQDLAATPAGKKVSNFMLVSGVAAHDLYHAGQIQLLKKLNPTRRSEESHP